ncbi:DUF6735 family protein [Haladaptatus sp. NG-WS-4]
MAHRALVAYERPDGRYDRHYAHWGATSLALRHRITPETPESRRRHPSPTGRTTGGFQPSTRRPKPPDCRSKTPRRSTTSR